MKLYNNLIILFVLLLLIPVSATQLNGRMVIMNNDGSNYKVLLQLNTDTESQKMGGASFVINYDTTMLNYSDNPKGGIDFIFSNFNLGFYDTAKVTKVSNGQLWLNIDLTSDGHGTSVQKGPNSWTDLVELNFETVQVVQNSVITWNVKDEFWGVYDSDNTTTWGKGNFDLVTDIKSINNQGNEITDYQLNQNFPNPFNPTTIIEYNVPQRSNISLVVYDAIGQKIKVLADGEKEPGIYRINFDASGLPSGIYFYRLSTENFIQTKKMILLKSA